MLHTQLEFNLNVFPVNNYLINSTKKYLFLFHSCMQDSNEAAEFQRKALQWYGKIGDYLNLFLLVVFSALLARKLDGSFTQSWFVVFVPLYVMSFFTILYVIGFDVNRYISFFFFTIDFLKTSFWNKFTYR